MAASCRCLAIVLPCLAIVLPFPCRYLAIAVPLPLPVPAVILSAAKDPEDIDSPPPSNSFHLGSKPFSLDHPQNRPS
jgi:hypothetical protein